MAGQPGEHEEVSPTAEEFDVVIIGGGPGGYAAALYGASAGLHIAMIEESRVGGTCLNCGCIPAKELLETATVLRTVRGASTFGVEVGDALVDLSVSQVRKQQVVDRLVGGLETLLKGRKVTVVPGTGTLVGGPGPSHLVRVSDGTELRGTNVVLATGSWPRALPGYEFDGTRILSSEHVLTLDHVPERTAVIGGGAIGCEFASFLVDVGSQVTVLEALPQVLGAVDKQVAQLAVRQFAKRGMQVFTGVTVANPEMGEKSVVVPYRTEKGEERLEVDAVIVSIGRSPRSSGAGIREAGVVVDERGFVAVDAQMRTNVAGVYAVGDLVATPQLAHVGFAEAIIAIKAMLGEDPAGLDYGKVPWGIYCHPEVAFCGMTEEQARAAGHDVVTSVHRFGGNGRALIVGEPDGLVKIVAERDGPLLGVHIVGPWATELIAEGYLSVNWEATAADLGLLIHAHPTLSELFGESALALTGRSLHG
ncbi:MAG TPA: dihydrolipoyl dehydrogenase [Acidimicrobiia bacterium]|nr:dihydrolipoyl dehydrogenase [Acidimicrobiia bacterium]